MIRASTFALLGFGPLIGLAGCGGLEKRFDQNFDKDFHDGCMKTATPKAGAATAERYCTCVLGQMKLSTLDRMTLDPNSDKANAAYNYCNAQIEATPS